MDKITLNNLLASLKSDPTLSEEEKERLDKHVTPDFLTKMMSGAFGASLLYLVAHFLKLKKTTQVLLAFAGFGLGKLLLSAIENKSDDVMKYNQKLKTVEMAKNY